MARVAQSRFVYTLLHVSYGNRHLRFSVAHLLVRLADLFLHHHNLVFVVGAVVARLERCGIEVCNRILECGDAWRRIKQCEKEEGRRRKGSWL